MKKFKKIMQDKVVQIILLLCFVLFTTVAIAAVYRNGQENTKETQPINMDEPTKGVAEGSEESKQVAEETGSNAASAGYDVGQQALVESQATQALEVPSEAANATAVNSPNVAALNFSEGSKLMWPVQGNILMDYSMDTTVYYATLKQYKVNPAVLIQGEAGVGIAAPADAQVVSVGSNEEIGTYVTLNLGNGYQAVIGNLKDLTVGQGQYVKKGNILGALSEPTAYYTVEGTNLYFELKNGEAPIDPLDYLE